ncbi:hypothetical protein ACC736_37990, partial [Rhizobium ruizarguesonis]
LAGDVVPPGVDRIETALCRVHRHCHVLLERTITVGRGKDVETAVTFRENRQGISRGGDATSPGLLPV